MNNVSHEYKKFTSYLCVLWLIGIIIFAMFVISQEDIKEEFSEYFGFCQIIFGIIFILMKKWFNISPKIEENLHIFGVILLLCGLTTILYFKQDDVKNLKENEQLDYMYTLSDNMDILQGPLQLQNAFKLLEFLEQTKSPKIKTLGINQLKIALKYNKIEIDANTSLFEIKANLKKIKAKFQNNTNP